jgi:thiol-disulfide isomerase/thioredoxin
VLERLLVAILIIAAGVVLHRFANRALLARRAGDGLGLPGYRPGSPAILYFTMPGCEPCENIQAPELARLQDLRPGWLQVVEVDAVRNPALADRWGVLGVPTTFVIDSQGRPRRVNHGVVRRSGLLAQLAEIGERLPTVDAVGREAVE